MSLYQRQDSEIWWASINLEGRPRLRQSTGHTDRRKAQAVHDRLAAELLLSAPALRGATWGKAVNLWLDKEERSTSELLSLQKFGRGFGDRMLSDVTYDNVHEALSFCKTPGTYMRYRAMIVAILNVARVAGLLEKVPELAVRRNKKEPTRKWITHEQWDTLYAELPAHMKPMAAFAIKSGLRQENVLQLQWSQVDLVAARAWFDPVEMKGNKGFGVDLGEEAVKVLEGQLGKHDVWVFPLRGKPVGDIKTGFISACVRAKLGTVTVTKDDEGKIHRNYTGFTWHGFRHTFATWHKQNGTPDDVLMKLGGWTDPRMVAKYAHHAPGYVASFVNNTRKK